MGLEEELGELEKGEIGLLLVEAGDYVDTNMEALRYLTEDRDSLGVYVTINKPYSTIKNFLEEHDVDTGKLFFVDAVSKEVGEETVDDDQVLFMDSPENLTGLSIVVSKAVDSMPDRDKFVFLDSLTTLEVYNEMDTVSRFAHFLTGKMRKWDASGVIISLEQETDEELVNRISQF
ncbi:MAG: ATPase domain-containing protein, partial [Candidatus Nanohaloarchaea archaeon]